MITCAWQSAPPATAEHAVDRYAMVSAVQGLIASFGTGVRNGTATDLDRRSGHDNRQRAFREAKR